MNPETLDIKSFPSEAAAKASGYDILLSEKQASNLQTMNRAQRRAWLKSKRKSGYMPSPKKEKV